MNANRKITTTVSTKGQVVLPKSIRQQRHWSAGTELVVLNTPDGVLLQAPSRFATTRPKDVFGSLAYVGPAITLEDMDAAVVAEAKRRYALTRY